MRPPREREMGREEVDGIGTGQHLLVPTDGGQQRQLRPDDRTCAPEPCKSELDGGIETLTRPPTGQVGLAET